MLFNSVQFAIFFVAVLGVLRAAPRAASLQVLLGASLLFYGLWIPAYLLLLLATLLLNYGLARAMLRSAEPRRYLIASIACREPTSPPPSWNGTCWRHGSAKAPPRSSTS